MPGQILGEEPLIGPLLETPEGDIRQQDEGDENPDVPGRCLGWSQPGRPVQQLGDLPVEVRSSSRRRLVGEACLARRSDHRLTQPIQVLLANAITPRRGVDGGIVS